MLSMASKLGLAATTECTQQFLVCRCSFCQRMWKTSKKQFYGAFIRSSEHSEVFHGRLLFRVSPTRIRFKFNFMMRFLSFFLLYLNIEPAARPYNNVAFIYQSPYM